ncbi:MAG: acetyl-CoA decarbonylase/synthase complex subunit delta [Dehalococcoidia bacterium]
MPEVEIPKEKWTGKVREVKIGGNGRKEIVVGGSTAMPFLDFEGEMPNPPRVAVEVRDDPSGFPPGLLSAWGDATNDVGNWAKKAAEAGAEIVVLRLTGAHPEGKNAGVDEAKAAVDSVLSAVDLPLMVIGPETADKDNEILIPVADLAEGQRIVIGNCVENNYKTIAATCIANNHIAIAKTPLDINLAKQLNVQVSDIGVPLESILMDPDMGALGYGIEYAISIDERLKLAALMGDAVTAVPVINHPGPETWRQKEAKVSEGVPESWGDYEERALYWEELSTTSVIHSGADVVNLCHPKAVEYIKSMIASLATGK